MPGQEVALGGLQGRNLGQLGQTVDQAISPKNFPGRRMASTVSASHRSAGLATFTIPDLMMWSPSTGSDYLTIGPLRTTG